MSVHNHRPHRPPCNERRLPDGQLRGACLNDDGPRTANLTITRGKRGHFTVQPITPAEMHRLDLADEWRTATPERREQIQAEVAALDGGAS